MPDADVQSESIDDVHFKVTAVDVGAVDDYTWQPVTAELASRTPDASVYEYEMLDELIVSIESEYTEDQQVEALGLVYRDSSGKIIGGWGAYEHWPKLGDTEEIRYQGDQIDDFTMPPRHSTVTFEALVPPEFDEDNVDLFVSPFITRDTEDPRWKCVSCFPNW